ncbi:MAG: DUF1573 domain-containing protein [Bacteroidales bacterium]
MKRTFFLQAVLILTALLLMNTGLNSSPRSGPKIVFDQVIYDFGTIKKNADGTCTFHFANKGEGPLVITKVTASCGCTVPSYPKEPILPGQSSGVKVAYNTKNVGVFTKTISVSTNDPVNSTVVLTIKGTVTK